MTLNAKQAVCDTEPLRLERKCMPYCYCARYYISVMQTGSNINYSWFYRLVSVFRLDRRGSFALNIVYTECFSLTSLFPLYGLIITFVGTCGY